MTFMLAFVGLLVVIGLIGRGRWLAQRRATYIPSDHHRCQVVHCGISAEWAYLFHDHNSGRDMYAWRCDYHAAKVGWDRVVPVEMITPTGHWTYDGPPAKRTLSISDPSATEEGASDD